jgi:hypothetical protein
MPGYGIAAATGGKGLLPWAWAEERLTVCHNYWVSTSRSDGRPHVMAVWGVWLGNELWFSTSKRSRKARNLSVNASCAVATERADEAVIVEGEARAIEPSTDCTAFRREYKQKYNWDMDATEGIYAVTPRVAFGFIEAPEDFPATATRWRFDD